MLLTAVYQTLIITLKSASFARTGVFGLLIWRLRRLLIFLRVFWSLLMTRWRFFAMSFISFGKFSENMLSICTTNPNATKLLMMTANLST